MRRLKLLGVSSDSISVILDLIFEVFPDTEIEFFQNKGFGIKPFLPVKNSPFYINPVGTPLKPDYLYVFGVSGPSNKKAIFEDFVISNGITKNQFLSIIHPDSYVAPSSKIDFGVLIEPKAVISSQSIIGFGTTIKRGSLIGHHNQIGEFCDINPGAVISGKVKIGGGSIIGAGAVLRDNITIGENTIIGMGSIVTKNIPSNCIAYGNPCKVITTL
jgi:sugar O-acyltransferase (sialic acid O-acetyltransferase NeuD family)